MRRKSSMVSWIGAGVVLVALVAAGIFLARKATGPVVTAAEAPAMIAVQPAASSSAIQHPITHALSPAAPATAPLPALADSDASVASALAALAGDDRLGALLLPTQVIPHIVASIDALPRQGQPTTILPVRSPKGVLITGTRDGESVIGAANAARYAPYMDVVEHVDSAALVRWYTSHYPLFQQAYQQLGYPRGYFNDRLVAVIDNLLATPDPVEPAALVQPNVFYHYQDPALEGLSSGQKIMLRVGPANEAVLKAKLRELRAALIGQRLPAAPTI